ncbi:hypothetical protein [Eubacterium barkeri]|uniref:Sulfatase-modifying factor enzyme 1 n=1 Tax=Eubacterium barkeri TaxID=1528 RepID=A0A1H3BL04_EUBBA|nr:hypothetical protein [Eubacterium barkeri]SDX42455.1 hypothetical protein SAMN04488579_102116 [Eubacterium barkeri]
MGAFDELSIAVDSLSKGRNKVILVDDAMGIQYPSIFVRFDKGKIKDVVNGSTNEAIHPAFLVGSAEKDAFWMGKYLGKVVNGHMLSLPLQDPSTGQNVSGGLNFNQALQYCVNNGDGHHLATQAEYAWMALQCRESGFMPRGNNSYGKDYSKQYEKGAVTYKYTSGETLYDGRTATGSGPISWNHDNTEAGVCDLNGNVYEWQAGYRTMDGEIQVLTNNNAAINADGLVADVSPTSAEWKAILPDGSLVTPGTAGTLKFDYLADPGTASASKTFQLVSTLAYQQTVEAPYGSMSFASLAAASGVTVPEILKALAIMPAQNSGYGDDYVYVRNIGERVPFRGGHWNYASNAGVFNADGYYPRSNSSSSVGARPAFIEQG